MMETKSLLYGIIGFLLGGLLVSIVATTQNDSDQNSFMQTQNNTQHTGMTAGQLENLKGDDFDKEFIKEMIMHHQGAIDMAKLIETNAKHDELKKLGQDIISAQTREIDMMRAWQKQWREETGNPSSDHGMDMMNH